MLGINLNWLGNQEKHINVIVFIPFFLQDLGQALLQSTRNKKLNVGV